MEVRRLVVGPLDANCYLLSSRGRAVAVDPGGEADLILGVLEEESLGLEAIVCTHGHFDHVGGCAELMEATGADLLAHPKAVPGLQEADEHALKMMGMRIPPPPPPTGPLEDGGQLEIPGCPLLVVHTPGHSPGSVCLVGEGLLVCGDLIFAGSVGRTDLPGGSAELMQRSIRRVLGDLKDGVRILPGHGPETTVGRERRGNPFLRGGFL